MAIDADASLRHLAAALRDQPRGALISGINPEPAQRDAEAVAQADEEIDVGDAPDPPGEIAAQLDPAEIDDGLALADLRQAAGVLVAERRQRLAVQPRLDQSCDIASLLLRGRCDARHRIAVRTCNGDRVADGKDIGMAGYGQIRLYLHAVSAIGGGLPPFRRPPGAHPRRPNDGVCVLLVAALDNAHRRAARWRAFPPHLPRPPPR